MAEKWVTIEAGSYAAGDRVYKAGTYKIDTESDGGKILVDAAQDTDWIKVHDSEPKQTVFTDSQIDFLRSMFPQLLEPGTAQQKLQQEYERLQAEKVAAAGAGANPDTTAVLTSAETRAADRAYTGLPATAPDAEKQQDYDAVKAEVQLAGADDTTAVYEAARQVSGATVSEDAPADTEGIASTEPDEDEKKDDDKE